MWRSLVCLLGVVGLVAPSSGLASPPALTARASVASGAAPLLVTLAAEGDGVSYTWQLGDGASSSGAVVQHRYTTPGLYTAVVTAASATGEQASAQVVVRAFGVSLRAPRGARFGQRVRFSGSLVPALANVPVALLRGRSVVARSRTRRGGGFAFRVRIARAGPFRARFHGVASKPVWTRVRPELRARIVGPRVVGGRLRLLASVRPASAGRLVARVWRDGKTVRRYRRFGTLRLGLRTERAASYRIRVSLEPARGFVRAGRTLRATVVQPFLSPGSRGVSVRALEARLAALRYALPRVDGLYGLDTYEAVLAFQKVEGLPWTGRVDARVWRALSRASPPRARYGGDHLEVSKGRQLVFVVRGGRVARAVHASTGATGNTPLGRFIVYRRVVGWDWVLWYPLYFLRGFAIHGYPSVPAYPASHGCVRVPMWIAPEIHATSPYGQTVHIYW